MKLIELSFVVLWIFTSGLIVPCLFLLSQCGQVLSLTLSGISDEFLVLYFIFSLIN